MTLKIRKEKGFTLVEIFIVGSLIALFAALAIINIQQQFQTNLRKITIGETKEIATALSFAYQDIGIFPKFCFLNRSLNMLYQISGSTDLPPDFDYMGYSIATLQRSLKQTWRGGYFALSPTRNRIAQGRGGVVRVLLPTSGEDIEWPADPWGNPYVLYLLYMDSEGRYNFILSPTQEPNLFTAVVSYGPNKVPGGSETITPEKVGQLKPYRLYEDYREDLGVPYKMLSVTEFFSPNPKAAVYTDPPDTDEPGIIDAGSDDIIFEF